MRFLYWKLASAMREKTLNARVEGRRERHKSRRDVRMVCDERHISRALVAEFPRK